MTNEFKPGTPSWVDLGTTDVAGAGSFYGALFGWTVEDLGPESGGYGLIRKDGKQVAGIGPATDPTRGTSWAVYFATDSADDTAAKVEVAGGTVVVAPTDVMAQGRFAVFQDPAGAYFSVWQAGEHRGAELLDEAGAMCWVELMTSDVPATKAFYEAVLGLVSRDVDVDGGQTYTLLRRGERDVAGAMAIGAEHGPMPSHWSVYFAVDDCDAAADTAMELGGSQMLREDSPAGRFAILTDPQGGSFSLI